MVNGEFFQASLTLLSLVNPVICGAIFSEAERDSSRVLADATRAAVTIFVILVSAALFGVKVLGGLGISLDAFQVAGGIVLGWMGFSMLRGSAGHRKTNEPSGENGPSLAPLVLFAASPGTITGVLTLAIHHSGDRLLPVSALVGISVTILVTWIVLVLTGRSTSSGRVGGLGRDITTRFMGLIVLAMGVQFALAGAQRFLA